MRVRRIVPSLLAVAVLAALAWNGARALRSAAAPPVAEAPSTRVRRGSVAITVSARGELQGGNTEMLTVPMVGSDTLTVTSLRQPGETVAVGDIVVQFDTTQQEYNLREAEADLAEARQRVIQTEADNQAADEEAGAAVEAAKTRVRVAELENRRNPVVSKMKARMNEIDLEAARNRLRQAGQDLANRKTSTAAALAIQRAGESRAAMMAAMAQKNIESMTLKAKTAGYVNLQPNLFGVNVITTGMTFPNVQIGDTVRPGMNIAQIPDLASWEVSAQVAEVDRGHLAERQQVTVSVVALGGTALSAHVKSLGNTTGQPWDRKFECRMTLDQAAPQLRPGMSSNLVILAERLDDVLWLPSQALFESDGRAFVYLKTPNGFTTRDVTLVKRSESQAVLTGIREGDVVALSNPSEQGNPPAKGQSAMKALSK